MTVKDIVNAIEEVAPPAYQESYDNSGLLIGNYNQEVTGVLLTVDVIPDIIEEAVEKNCNLIISHHPIIFFGLKRITGSNYIEKSIIKAIENKISIYCGHTSLDVAYNGVNYHLAKKIDLKNIQVLHPIQDSLFKIVTFVPQSHSEKVRQALFEAGAGKIGNYDSCSYCISGTGTFRGNDNANPFVGEIGKIHLEEEIRIETIFPKHLKNRIIKSLLESHPYEEPAYDIFQLSNTHKNMGLGVVGTLETEQEELTFLNKIKNTFNCSCIRHTKLLGKKIKKVAICGGSGSELLKDAIIAGGDIFITADFKYHQFFDAEDKLIIADIGHYESEQFTKEIFYDILTKNFSNFAVHFSKINTNPINYL
mgnify:CR=1 FL=1